MPDLFPNGRKQGGEWRLANIQGDPPRKAGSCVITLRGEHAGDWIDFDGGRGGGPLDTLRHATKLSGRALLARAAELAGCSPDTPNRQQRKPAARAPERDTARDAAAIRQGAVPITATPAETYLRQRGLRAPAGADLLFRPDLMHWATGTRHPAMIGVVRNRAGEPMAAVHRTYLRVDPGTPEQVGKAPVDKPRMMLGKTGGGAVRLAPIPDDGVLGLSEGIETGLAAMTACPALAVWATLSTSGLEQAQLPPEARRIIILADHDASGAGMRAAEAAARRFQREGRQVAIALPPRQGDDFNDLLLREGAEAVRATIQAALDGNSAGDGDSPVETGCNLPIGFVEPSGSLPALRADEGDLAQVTAYRQRACRARRRWARDRCAHGTSERWRPTPPPSSSGTSMAGSSARDAASTAWLRPARRRWCGGRRSATRQCSRTPRRLPAPTLSPRSSAPAQEDRRRDGPKLSRSEWSRARVSEEPATGRPYSSGGGSADGELQARDHPPLGSARSRAKGCSRWGRGTGACARSAWRWRCRPPRQCRR